MKRKEAKLFDAIEQSNLERVNKTLSPKFIIFNLKPKIDFNTRKDGEPLLSKAIEVGNKEIVELLINKGININYGNIDNSTPLMKACFLKKNEIALMLIKKGADLNAHDNSGNSPLSLAIHSKNKDITKFLLKENVEINVKPALLKSSSFKAYLPINEAIRNGWDDIVEELIENDVNLNNQDLYGDTPLHRTAIEGNTKVLNLLLEKGMDVNILDKKGNTPLHIASKYNRLHIVELLLNNGAIVDKRNDKGLTALCESSNQTASLLIKHGAQIDEFVVYKKPHLAIKNEIEIIANSNDSIYEDTYWQDEEDHRRWYDFAQFEEITSLANSTNEKDNKKALEKLENEKKEFEDFYFIYGWEILLKSRFGDIDGARKALFHGLKFSKRKSSLCSNLATTEFQEHKNIILAIRWWIESAKMQLNSSNYDRWTTHTPFLYLSYVHDSYKLEKVANLIIVPQTVRLDANEEDKLRTLLSTIDEKLLNIINNEIDTELIDKIGSLDLGI